MGVGQMSAGQMVFDKKICYQLGNILSKWMIFWVERIKFPFLLYFSSKDIKSNSLIEQGEENNTNEFKMIFQLQLVGKQCIVLWPL